MWLAVYLQDFQIYAMLGTRCAQKSLSVNAIHGTHQVYTRGFLSLAEFLHRTRELEEHSAFSTRTLASRGMLERHSKRCKDLTRSHATATRRQTNFTFITDTISNWTSKQAVRELPQYAPAPLLPLWVPKRLVPPSRPYLQTAT